MRHTKSIHLYYNNHSMLEIFKRKEVWIASGILALAVAMCAWNDPFNIIPDTAKNTSLPQSTNQFEASNGSIPTQTAEPLATAASMAANPNRPCYYYDGTNNYATPIPSGEHTPYKGYLCVDGSFRTLVHRPILGDGIDYDTWITFLPPNGNNSDSFIATHTPID